jgi:hypothetical protein
VFASKHLCRLLPWACAVGTVSLAACGERVTASYDLLVRVESDPGVALAGARLASGGSALGQSDGEGLVALSLVGNPGDTVSIDTSCPEGHRSPKEPLRVVLKPLAEQKRPEFRVSCQPLKRSMVLTVRTQHGADLPVRYLGKEIARTDSSGAAHALLEVTPGESVTVTLDTSAREHAQLMPQNPELKTVVPERDEIVIFDQAFMLPKPPPQKRVRRRESTGPQKLVAVRAR